MGGIGPVEVPVPSQRLETYASTIDPGAVLRRSVAAWGLGHLALGDPRGWVLLMLEIAWILVFGVSLALLATDRWLVAYSLLAGFIVAWVAQAVAAYRLARARSGNDNGAAWLLALAPGVIALLTGFWLISGAQASPASTFERYVGAWRHGDAGAAIGLFATPTNATALGARWTLESRLIADRINALADANPEFGLDTAKPEANLRFDLHDEDAVDTDPGEGPVQFDVNVVRQVSLPTTFFGLVPASRTETRNVETVGRAMLVRRLIDGPLAATGASVWVIESIGFSGEP